MAALLFAAILAIFLMGLEKLQTWQQETGEYYDGLTETSIPEANPVDAHLNRT
jgi:hypothetical protein